MLFLDPCIVIKRADRRLISFTRSVQTEHPHKLRTFQMPAVLDSCISITLTLDESYNLAPPVYLVASFTDRPLAPTLMLAEDVRPQIPGQTEKFSFRLSFDIAPGTYMYRYRLGAEDSENFIVDHKEETSNKDLF